MKPEASGIYMALFVREQTGKGQKVDIGMVDALVSALEDKLAHYSVANEMPVRVGNAHPMIAPYDTFMTKDGYVALGVSTDDQWEKFCQAMSMTELLEDERYNSNEKRGANYFTGLRDTIENMTKTINTDKILSMAEAGGIPAGKVSTVVEAIKLPQITAREMLVKVDDPGLGKITMPGIHVKLHDTPGAIEKLVLVNAELNTIKTIALAVSVPIGALILIMNVSAFKGITNQFELMTKTEIEEFNNEKQLA